MEAIDYLARLRAACARAGVGHTTYCVLGLIAAGRASTVPGLAMSLNMTQKGIKDASLRRAAHLFQVDRSTVPVTYALSPEGIAMLAKVRSYMPQTKPAKPTRAKHSRPISSRTQLLLDL